MISTLHIKNIGIIEDLSIDLNKGLNVLTGETGAGKTLIIDSLQIISGGRFSNTNNLEEYIKNITNNELEKNIIIEEEQTLEDKKREFMMLGFRKIEGVNISKFKEKFVDNPIFIYREKLNKLVEEGLIEIDLNNIRLTNKGIDFANLVFEEFI